jgi:hypothetical protein
VATVALGRGAADGAAMPGMRAVIADGCAVRAVLVWWLAKAVDATAAVSNAAVPSVPTAKPIASDRCAMLMFISIFLS